MGCGGSKSVSTVETVESRHTAQAQQTQRAKTPSVSSSSSGVSSYRRSQSLRQSDTPGSHDVNRNKQDDAPQQQGEEQRRRAEQAEEEGRRQQQEAQEEERRRQEQEAQAAEERRRQDEAQAEEARRQQELLAIDQSIAAATVVSASSDTHTAGGQEQGGGRTFTPLEIYQHNSEIQWVEWVPHNGKVYDCNGIRAYFPDYVKNRRAMLRARAAQRVQEGGEEEEKEFVTYRHLTSPSPDINELNAWMYNGVKVLRSNGLSEEELAKELPRFLMGTILDRSGPAFWDGFRRDVTALAEELRVKGDEDKASGEQEYLSLLTRWQAQYGAVDPPEQPPASDGTDPNEKNFPLPAVDPDSLRLYVLEGEPLDTDLPPDGAWGGWIEEEVIDLGDPHDIFTASLRDSFATEGLLFLAEGEVGWEELPDDAVKNEVMTPQQEEIQAARDQRTDLDDPERMKRRREKLCQHFIEVRELAPDVVMSFMQWASLLEANKAELEQLC